MLQSAHLSPFHARGQRNAIRGCDATVGPRNFLAVEVKLLLAQLHHSGRFQRRILR